VEHDREHFESLQCPSPPPTWENDIKGLFTTQDVEHMKTKGIDLSSYDSVSINATTIYSRVKSGSMPPPGSGEARWTTEMVNTFGCWIQAGKPES